eukprot:6918590-Prorocentrum_lima.AAC.1
MTSSLVGSEMCIRDRESADWLGGRRPCHWHWQRHRQTGVLLLPRGGCLLYTSDAADDMHV